MAVIPATPEPKLVRAIVAPSHTIWIGNPPNPETKTPDTRVEKMPGQEVRLSEGDYQRLLAAGFLVNPDGSVLAPGGNGPEFYRDTISANPAGIGPRSAGSAG
jgi:hypothetical protein